MIDLLADDDQQHLVDAVVAFLERQMPIERLRPKPGDTGMPPQRDRWADFAELGWLSLGLPESLGGAGYGIIELMLVFREFGRYLLPLELLSTTVGARASALTRPEAGEALGAGKMRAGLATALLAPHDFHLIGATNAQLLVSIGEHVDFYPRESFRDIERVECLDDAVELSRATLQSNTHAYQGSALLADEGRVLACAMLTGVAEATRDLAVDYAKTRQQFGQTIGSFQAIKHICADMAVRAEASHSLTALAAVSLAAGEADAAFQVGAASAIAARAAIENASQAIQVHGAIGFTLECDVHLYLKRAHVLDRLLRPAIEHR